MQRFLLLILDCVDAQEKADLQCSLSTATKIFYRGIVEGKSQQLPREVARAQPLAMEVMLTRIILK